MKLLHLVRLPKLDRWEMVTSVGRLRVAIGDFEDQALKRLCRWLEEEWQVHPISSVANKDGTSDVTLGMDTMRDQKLFLTFTTGEMVVELGPLYDYTLKDMVKGLRKEMKSGEQAEGLEGKEV